MPNGTLPHEHSPRYPICGLVGFAIGIIIAILLGIYLGDPLARYFVSTGTNTDGFWGGALRGSLGEALCGLLLGPFGAGYGGHIIVTSQPDIVIFDWVFVLAGIGGSIAGIFFSLLLFVMVDEVFLQDDWPAASIASMTGAMVSGPIGWGVGFLVAWIIEKVLVRER